MKSGGFGIGKKQASQQEPKRLPPTNADLTNLLATSQKSPDKSFTLSWLASADSSLYVLTVHFSSGGGQKDRRGWSSSAIDNSGGGVAEWKLHRDLDGRRTELFSMQSSDAYLIQSVIEEALVQGSAKTTNNELFGAAAPPQPAAAPTPSPQTGTGSQSSADKKAQFEEGNLRQTSAQKLMEHFHESKATGRLICDIGTVTAEVFFTDGEPVHAKSCHSIYGDRDSTGDGVIVDLLTWKEGDFKFQDRWPAATRTVTKPLSAFLGTTGGAAGAAGGFYGNAQSTAAPPASSYGGTSSATASSAASTNPDDFSNADDVIGEVYANMVESSGLLKYGMFLMLARTEFARFEIGKVPFCVAAIGLDSASPISDEALGKIEECFEPVGQPLDILAYASRSRLYALFPHSNAATASTSLKHFINGIEATPLAANLPGSAVKVTIGLCEVPRDGTDFQQIFEHACRLRLSATAEKRIVASV